MQSASRCLGELAFPEVSCRLKETSILCLPLGAIEQHGPHLPLNTDIAVAEGLCQRIVARWGDEFDLWQLPTISLGMSREHDWAPGTLSLSIEAFVKLLREIARELVRALPARNLLIMNGHGGNRGVLENLLHELQSEFALNCCVVHPFDLACRELNFPAGDVHAGLAETSVMLVMAPHLVRQERLESTVRLPDQTATLIFDRAVSFPWRSNDPRLARNGVIGDAGPASVQLGQAIIDEVVRQIEPVLLRLLENQQTIRGSQTSV